MSSPWPTFDAWLLPAFFLAFGALFLLMAWNLLREYRHLFLANPRAMMSLDVISEILGTGAPGYLGAFGLLAGVFFLGVGLLLLLVMILAPLSEVLRQLAHVIGLGLQ